MTRSDEINKTAYHLPKGCTRLGMRYGKITKAFVFQLHRSSHPEVLYEFVTEDNEIINLKWGEFSYSLVEEWLRNDMIKEAIREVDK